MEVQSQLTLSFGEENPLPDFDGRRPVEGPFHPSNIHENQLFNPLKSIKVHQNPSHIHQNPLKSIKIHQTSIKIH